MYLDLNPCSLNFIFKNLDGEILIMEFANIILKNLSVKTGNVNDALSVMKMVEKIYSVDNKWR